MTLDNKDILTIKLDHPLIGVSAINKVDVDGTGLYSVYVRTSKDDGLTWSDWTISKDNFSLDPKHFSLIEYKIIAESDSVEINSISAELEYERPVVPAKYQEMSLSRFVAFYDVEVMLWTLNVFNKVYNPGIVPKYIERSEDFVHIWLDIIYLQALKVYYNVCLGEIFQDRSYARKYAESRGLYIGSNNSIDEIFNSLKYFYQQMSQRGSIYCFKYFDGTRGEVLRLLNSTEYDENTVGLMNINESGWLLDFSSPLEERINPGLHNLTKKIYRSSAEFNDKTNINTALSYRISFYFSSSTNGVVDIDLGLNFYDSLDKIVYSDYFLRSSSLPVKADYPIKVDCILFASGKGFNTDSKIGAGKYLQFTNKNMNKLAPIFSASGSVTLEKIEVAILDINTFIYLYSEKMLFLYLTNNTTISESKLKEIIENDFTPVSANTNITLL